MASRELLIAEITQGENLIRVLDKEGFPVTAALWLYSSDDESWKLVIASPEGKVQIQKKYLDVATIAAKYRNEDCNILDLNRISIIDDGEPFIAALKLAIRADGINQIRFSNNVINGIFVEDALIYRMAA